MKYFTKAKKYYKLLNDNKVITGIFMIILNVSSKYISFDLTNAQEYYLKHFIGKKLLIFSILWMGTRDIFVSLILTCIFILFSNYLFNDQSYFCIIPNKYKNINQVDTNKNITEKDIQDAIHTLKNAYYNQNKDN
jgi:hypothetical protein